MDSRWLGTLRGQTGAVRASEPFVMAGIEWVAPVDARVEMRAHTTNGRWTPWTLASVQGHDSDAGESFSHACFGEPVWTGAAVELQLRSSRRVDGLTVHLVAQRTVAGARRAVSAGASPTGAPAATRLPLAEPTLAAGPGQPLIIARSAWAGDHGPATPPTYGDVRMMFVHHSVNANGYSAAEVPAILLSIYDFHRYVRGWNDIGYNFAIDAFGRVWEARAGGIDQAVVGAQAGGYNLESSGVVMLGTFAAVLPTAAALETLTRLLAWKLSLHGVPVSGFTTVEVDPSDAFYTAFRPGQHVTLPRIAGHRDGCTTDCPGTDLYDHLPVVRANVRRLVGTQLALSLDLDPGQGRHGAEYLSLATASLTAGEPLSLTGRLVQLTNAGIAGPPVSGATVEIQSLEGQTESVLTGVASATEGPFSVVTGDAGRFAVGFSPMRNMLVRVLKLDPPAVASSLVAIAVAPALTLALASESPLTLTGTVTPRKVTLELLAYAAGGAHALKHHQTFETQADGTFILRPKLAPGAYWIRVVAAADPDNVPGQSRRLTLTI